MPPAELLAIIEADHVALHAMMRGDPEPKKQLYSHADDATLANPLGPPARGWAAISSRLDQAASALRDGQHMFFERISDVTTEDLAYIIDVEHYHGVRVGTVGPTDFALRVTTVFRREADGWRIVHRHADAITTERPHESVLNR